MGINPYGDVREITPSAPLKSDEILIPQEVNVEEVKSWPRARRRAYYREQVKLQGRNR